MTITANLVQTNGAASAAGTVIGTQAIAAPASWTKLTTLGVIPTGGAVLQISSDAEAFRYFVMDPRESSNASTPDVAPPHNGILVPWYGGTVSTVTDNIEAGQNAQVWVKQA